MRELSAIAVSVREELAKTRVRAFEELRVSAVM